jgi:hypothetical protein
MTNVIDLEQFRRSSEARWETPPDLTADELARMRYGAVLDWAGSSFDRLVAVAKARDYRPEWILHQMADHGRQLTGPQDALIAQMIRDAGPFLPKRQRWIMRQLADGRQRLESALAKMAESAVEFREYKRPAQCVRNDLYELQELGLIESRDGIVVKAASAATAPAQPRNSTGATP